MDKDSDISQAEPLGLISRSITRVARQTHKALTPWVQRTLNRSSALTNSSVSRASPEPAPRMGSLGVVGRRAESFVERIQRKGWDAAVWNAAPVTDRVIRMDTFATGIVRRFPDISTKYERTQTEATAPSQQAAMPFQGAVQAPTESAAMPQMPTFDAPSSIQMSPSPAAAEPAMTFQAMRERVQRAMSEQREQSSGQQPEAGPPPNPPSATATAPSGLPPLGQTRVMPSRDAGRIRRYTRIEEVTNRTGTTPTRPTTPLPSAPVQRQAESSPETMRRQAAPAESSPTSPDATPMTKPATTPDVQRMASPVQRASEPATTIRRSTDSAPALRPLPKPVPMVDVTPVETRTQQPVQREAADTPAPRVANVVESPTADDPTGVPSIQRALANEMPLRLPPAVTSSEPSSEMPSSILAAPAELARSVEAGAQTEPPVQTTSTAQATVVQRSAEKPAVASAANVQHKPAGETEAKPVSAQATSVPTESIQRATVKEPVDSEPATIQRALSDAERATTETTREPVVGTIQRMSAEPTIVQRQATEMPLREPAPSGPATGTESATSDTTPTATGSGTMQAGPQTSTASPSIQRTAAPAVRFGATPSVQHTTTTEPTATRTIPSIERKDTAVEVDAEPAPKATIVPSAPTIQRAIDDVMPLRATPTPGSETDSGSNVARNVEAASTPTGAPSLAPLPTTVQRSTNSETPNATPKAESEIEPLSPTATPAAEPTVQRTQKSEPATVEPTEPTRTESPAPVARLFEATPGVGDTPSIQRQIGQEMPLRMKPAEDAPVSASTEATTSELGVTSGNPATIQRYPQMPGASSSATPSAAQATARTAASKIPPGFRPLPQPMQAVQRTTDESAPQTSERDTPPKTSASPLLNRPISAPDSGPSAEPRTDAPASLQRSSNVAQDMPLRQPTPTARSDSPISATPSDAAPMARPETPPSVTPRDSAPTTPQAHIQRSAQPTAAAPKQAEPPTYTVRRRTPPPPSANIQTSAPSSIQRAASQALPLRVQPQSAETVEATPAETFDPVGVLPASTSASPAPTVPVVQRAVARRDEQPASETGGITIQRQADPRVMARIEAGPLSRAITNVQMPLVYRKSATTTATDGGSVAETPKFDLPLVRAGVLPQTSVQRAETVMDGPSGTVQISGPVIQRSAQRSDLPLRRSSTATRTEPAARKNITIESPVFRAQQQTIQRRWKTRDERNAAFKDLKNSLGKGAKQFFSKVKKEKSKEPEQKAPSGDQNLDELAEKIMPIVKRMLAIERERRFGRTSNL